jgi:hypothetical protein
MSFGAFGDTPQNAYIRHVNGTENDPSKYKYTVNGINYQLVKDGDRYCYKNVSDTNDNNRYYLSTNDRGISVTTLMGGRKMRQHRRKSSRKMRQHRRKSLRTRRGRSH